ncbi:Wzz/FepE/Etk N-terminal domain-containing protein [Spirosoma daeguense]
MLGVAAALLTQPEFVSEARIMPEMNSGSSDVVKRLASVAGFAGMDFSDSEGMDAVRPDLYPNVIQSTPFGLYLLEQPITTSDSIVTTIANLLMTSDGLSIRRWFRNGIDKREKLTKPVTGKPVRLTRRQQDLLEEVGRRVSAKLDTRSGIISITAQMPDANAAASVAQLAMNYLTQYVTDYRTEKARQDLQFYTQRLQEARQRYQSAQYAAFHYNDQHKYYVVQAATMEKQRTESELAIAQTVYTELSRQFEQAKLKVQERTPVFKILEPAKIPVQRSSPKRTLMVLVFTTVGFMVGLIWLLLQQIDLTAKWRATLQASHGATEIHTS